MIPIINYAWERSFAKTHTHFRAIHERGWGPLNKILLQHPEISSTNSVNCLSPEESNSIHNNPIHFETTKLNINIGI